MTRRIFHLEFKTGEWENKKEIETSGQDRLFVIRYGDLSHCGFDSIKFAALRRKLKVWVSIEHQLNPQCRKISKLPEKSSDFDYVTKKMICHAMSATWLNALTW